jgi:hypothetical protein
MKATSTQFPSLYACSIPGTLIKSPSNTIPVDPTELRRNTSIGSARMHASCSASESFAVDAQVVLLMRELKFAWKDVAVGRLKFPPPVPLSAIAWLKSLSSRPAKAMTWAWTLVAPDC